MGIVDTSLAELLKNRPRSPMDERAPDSSSTIYPDLGNRPDEVVEDDQTRAGTYPTPEQFPTLPGRQPAPPEGYDTSIRPRVAPEQPAPLQTPVQTPAQTPAQTPQPASLAAVTEAAPSYVPENAERLKQVKDKRAALNEKPTNKDHGVRGFLKELLSNTLYGIGATRQANPNAGVWEMLAGGATAGGIGAVKRDFNELRDWQGQRAIADQDYNREQDIADKDLDRQYKAETIKGQQENRRLANKREDRMSAAQNERNAAANKRLDQSDVKMLLNYATNNGFDPDKDTWLAEQLKSHNIELEPTAGKAQPRVWMDGALMERDQQTGSWKFASDQSGDPMYSQGRGLVQVQTPDGNFLMPNQSAGFASITNQGRIAQITNAQTQAEAQADYEYEQNNRTFKNGQSQLVAKQTEALSKKTALEQQLASIDPKVDYDGKQREALKTQIAAAQADADGAAQQFKLNLQNAPVKRQVSQSQTPQVSFGKTTATRAEIENSVRTNYPNLKGKQFEDAVNKVLASGNVVIKK